jgi:tetratricopeptide (TPR) repeat protein
VEAVAEGSVHPEGDEFQVNLRLIRGENGALIWSGSFRERTSDFPRLARDVASGIIQAAGLHLTQQQSEELAAQPGTDPQAREDYLKGRYYMGQLTESSRTKALSYFERAVVIAPDFAPAYVGMVDFYEITDTIPPRNAIPKTKFYALKALRLNPGLSSAHTALAVARFYQDWDWEGSQREFRRALELDPGSERAHRMYALMLSCTGRVQEAINQIHQAHQLDPLSIPIYDMASMIWLNAHQFDQSIQQAEQLLELNPNSVSGHVNLGAADLFEGRFPRAIEEFKTAAADGGDGALMAALLGPAYARWGKWRLAEEQLTSLKRWSKRRYVPPIWFAMVDASLGADRRALDSLERDFRDRDSYMAFLKVTPWFDSLRDEPRFHKLIQQMNFPG